MEIRSPAHFANIATAATPAQQVASLKLGAILDVIVQARLGENRFQLQPLSEGESLTGMSQTELSVGQRLQVQVTRLGALPELRILPAETPPPEVVPKALRELLPKQIDVKELISMLGRLPASTTPSLPEPVRVAVERLVAILPQAEKLMTPEGLQKAIQNSGLFLEASLAAVLTNGAELPESDLKARLLNLLSVLQKWETGKPAAQTATLQSAARVRNDSSEQGLPHPEKVAQKSENASVKMTGDRLLLQSRDQGVGMPQLPVARNASLPSANKIHNDVSGQDMLDLEKRAQKQEAALMKIIVNPSASQPDLQKSDIERLTATSKYLLQETIQSATQNETHASADKVKDDFTERDMLILEKFVQRAEGALAKATQTVSHSLTDKAQDHFSERDMLILEKLAQKAEGALAKITVDQLASQSRDNGAISLQLNIPFVEGNYQDNAKLQITSEGASAFEDRVNSFWTATIELQPPGLGTFNARIIWNGTQIDAFLWSDQEGTSNSIRHATETLRARLEQAGLAIGAVTVLDQSPSSSSAEADAQPLLDLRV
jgi:hypothetical protein